MLIPVIVTMKTTTFPIDKTDGIPLELNNNATDRGDIQCASRHSVTFLVFSFFPGLAVVMNLTVLAAVLRMSRKLMRQSHVYAHVSSTLAGNVLFSLLSLIQILSLYFNFGGFPNDPDPFRRGMVQESTSRWWPFHKAFLCGMFVIMCGNIGLLIDSIRHNTCSTLRMAAGHKIHANENNPKNRKRIFTRRQRSYFHIAALWILPLIYVIIPAAVGWNCARTCQCLSECFPSNHLNQSRDHSCSRVFPPMTNSWMSVVVLSWLTGSLITIWLLKRSVKKVTKMWSQSSTMRRHEERADIDKTKLKNTSSFSVVPDDHNDVNSLNGLAIQSILPLTGDGNYETDLIIEKQGEANSCGPASGFEKESGATEEKETKKLEAKYFTLNKQESIRSSENQKIKRSSASATSQSKESGTHRRMVEHLRNTKATTFSLRYVIYLTVSFTIFTSPTMILLSTDILNPTFTINMVILNLCLMSPFVYCYICPFILVKCLPGVKNSLSSLLLSVYSTSA